MIDKEYNEKVEEFEEEEELNEQQIAARKWQQERYEERLKEPPIDYRAMSKYIRENNPSKEEIKDLWKMFVVK